MRKQEGNRRETRNNSFTGSRDNRKYSSCDSDSDIFVETDAWKFPKRTIKSRHCPETIVKTQNRFDGLENHASLEDNAFVNILTPQSILNKPLESDQRKKVIPLYREIRVLLR